MKRFRLIIAIILMVASIILLFSYMFNPQPIQIVLETGQDVMTKSSNYFTLTTVVILIICAFIIGSTATYLFYNADNVALISSKPEENQEYKNPDYKMVLPLLKGDERKAVHALIENNGEMLQNALVLKLNLSKVKTTRILSSLHDKQIIIKERHGLTNKIKLKPLK